MTRTTFDQSARYGIEYRAPKATNWMLLGTVGTGATKLDTMRAAGKVGPTEVHFGRSVLWSREEVMAWLARPTPKGELMDARTWAGYWREQQRRKSQ